MKKLFLAACVLGLGCSKDTSLIAYRLNTAIGAEWVYQESDGSYRLHRNERVTSTGLTARSVYSYDNTSYQVGSKIKEEYIGQWNGMWGVYEDSIGSFDFCPLPDTINLGALCSNALLFSSEITDYKKIKHNHDTYKAVEVIYSLEDNGQTSKHYYATGIGLIRIEEGNSTSKRLIKINF